MEKYTLYLDESETEDKSGNKFFCIGGIIVSDNYHNNELKSKLSKSKCNIWSEDEKYDTYILHELEINEAHNRHFSNIKAYNKMFVTESNYSKVYKEMAYILSDKKITTIGVSVSVYNINKYYDSDIVNNKFTICMQPIIENFCHFLITNNAIGSICYEDLQTKQNGSIMKKFNQILNTGTMFYSPRIIQKYVNGLVFRNKNENITGLQIADFIPNDLARTHANKKPKYNKTHKVIRKKLYDGNLERKDMFGFKKIL